MTKGTKLLRKFVSDFYMVLILIFLYAPIVSWLKGTNNRKQPPLLENYFKMIAVEIFTAVSRCSFATVNTETPPEMYNQLKTSLI